MLSIEALRGALHSRPFRRFVLRTSDGRQHPDTHPEAVAISPRERAIFVWYDNEHWDIVELLHITGIHYGNGRARRPRARRGG